MSRDDLQPYDYTRPVRTAADRDDPLFLELVSTTAFKRLGDIRFLGGIDYFLVRHPNGAPGNRRYTRQQHSLGVARLADLYAEIVGLPQKDRRLVCSAALLHDVGHAPLSHTLEAVFKRSFGIDHHIAGSQILLGESPLGREITDILLSYGLDPEEVLALASGALNRFDGFFSGPINFDTIEGILRSWKYVRPKASAPSPDKVVFASINRATGDDRATVDGFWQYKDYTYNYVVRSEFGVASDFLCESVVFSNISRLSRSDYFLTEKQLFGKVPELRELFMNFRWRAGVTRGSARSIPYKARRFSVDHRFDFFSRNDRCRYTQRREDRVMEIPDPVIAGELPQPRFPAFIDDLDLHQDN
ncbi:HD domain-containing protein [Phenylobacterium sp.]|uniref:HD domain-containing protein n=1 Tax=Phenylobacterium sp. TaxID=1871053 RepID=UPI0035C80DCF